MKKILTTFLFISSLIYANVIGEYKDSHGSTIKIEKNGTAYTLTARDSDGSYWEGIGFYSQDGKYLKSVFQYISNKKTYGDSVGFHKFEIKDNGKTLIKYGGWSAITEFGTATYTKK
jgi:uncharacterized protein YxeA